MLNRLVGLETEYAIRFHPDHPLAASTVDYQLYHALVHALGKRTLTAPANDLKEGVFFLTGGAVWFEFVRFAGGHGLIEGSTPECRGPREMLLHQRAQDLLLSEAARDADVPGVFSLVKNDCDSQGHIYGAQENYELTLATGWRLRVWRFGLYLLFPLMLLAWLGYGLLNIVLRAYFLLAGMFCFLVSPVVPVGWSNALQRALLGEVLGERIGYTAPIPSWLETVGLGFMRIIAGPLALGIYLLVRLTAFKKIRRELLPFLISRPLIAGAGFVDQTGRFQLSDKAWGMNCVLGYNGIVLDRPIFSIGHLFKALMFRAWSSPREFSRLFSPKQRLQVCLGDSNMAEEAEYLRIGTTLLVLDAIEAGYLAETPNISRPIKALRTICADPALSAKVRFQDGRSRSALEIQQHYFESCAKFVAESQDAKDEAKDILNRWGEMLSLLETNPSALVGRLDWVTKRYLLESTTEEGDDLAVKKKIDLRYHELSADGYYRQLETTGITRSVLTAEEIEAATETPPKDTPATVRSRYLKTFAPSQRVLGVNWNTITISQDFETKRIELSSEISAPKESSIPPKEKDSR